MWNEIKFAVRHLLRSPGFTAVAVLTLALGIGANTAIFSLVNAVLLKSLPVRAPERLFFVTSGNNVQVCYPLIERLQRANEDIGETLAYRTSTMRLSVSGHNEVALGQLVSGNYFSGLGINLPLGRGIVAGDDQLGATPVAVISFRCWVERFGHGSEVLGETVSLNGIRFTIIGVAPREFYGLDGLAVPEIFVPVRQHALLNPGEPRVLSEYGSWVFSAVTRLKSGVAEEVAQVRLSTLYQQLVAESAREWIRPQDLPKVLNRGVRLVPAARGVAKLREKFSQPLVVLTAASGLVFLIACANVANLLLARGMIRQREIALRLAMGSSRWRVARLLLLESFLLTSVGSVAGAVFAAWSSQGLSRFLPEEAVGILDQGILNSRLLGFSILASFAATVLVGLVPALRGSRLNLNAALSGGGRISSGSAVSRLRGSLVVTQVALSLVLLIGAGLLVRSLRELVTLDPGFRRENVLLLTLQPNLAGYRATESAALMSRLAAPPLLERLEAVPGVRSASLSSFRPFGDRSRWRLAIHVVGATAPTEDRAGTSMRWVTPKFFETLGIPFYRGRLLSSTDSPQAPKVAVINETMAQQYFGTTDPLGKRFKLSSGLEALGEIEVVGVVRNTKTTSLRDEVAAMFYLPFAQFANGENLVFAIRSAGPPEAVAAAVRREIESVDANLAITKVTTLSEVVNASMTQERALATLSASFGVLALLLAAIGLYGVLAYAVTQRTREIGLRLALGAQPGSVLKLILVQGMRLAGLGLVLGLLGAGAFSRVLRSQLFGVSPTDPITFLLIPAFLLLVALLACWLPGRRAARLEPMEALRVE